KNVYVSPNGTRHTYSGEQLPVSETTAAEIDKLIELLNKKVTEMDVERPWDMPNALELDSISFRDWLQQHSDDQEAIDNVSIYIASGMLTKPAHTFSALQAILMAASAGSFSNLVDEDFILDKRVVGGLQQVSIHLAERLGDDVFLNAPVRTLEWGDDGVVAHADGDVTVRARFAILAHAPVLYDRISFVPPLPRRQHQMHQ